jgi:hypothetical protein
MVGGLIMQVSFYVSEWQADDSLHVGGGECKDRFLYSKEIDVLPVRDAMLYHTVVETGKGIRKTKYRVLSVDWSVMTLDNGYTSHEVQVRMIERN